VKRRLFSRRANARENYISSIRIYIFIDIIIVPFNQCLAKVSDISEKLDRPYARSREIMREWISNGISSGHDIVFVTSQLFEIVCFFLYYSS